METTQSLLGEYESAIERLFKSDEWFKGNGFSDWKEVDDKFRNARLELEKKVYKIQEELHNSLNINPF